MYLLVGLGNPGRIYAGTRHNLGFRVIEALYRLLPAGPPVERCRSLCAVAQTPYGEVILAQPLTYMNRSGRAVLELLRRYPVEEPEHLVLIYDDLDLPPGTIRLRRGGGSAGHRGVRSVIESLGTGDFVRLRLGIGKPPPGVSGAVYVLQRPPPEERGLLEGAVERAAQAALVLMEEGLDTAMNRFNRALPT